MRNRENARVRAGLFDRLTDDRPSVDEIRPFSTLDRDGLVRSLERELQRLLNTRCPFSQDELQSRSRTTIDYGIPDFGSFQEANPDDRKRLADAIRDAVRSFEPRLEAVQVEVEPYPGRPHSAFVRVRGRIQLGRVPEPVAFILNLERLD